MKTKPSVMVFFPSGDEPTKGQDCKQENGSTTTNLPTCVVVEWAMSAEGGPHYGSGDQMDGLRWNPVDPRVNVALSAMHRRRSSDPIVP